MNDLGCLRVARIQAVHTKTSPDRCQAAERLPTRELVAAIDPLGLGRREQERQIVAGLGVSGSEDLTGGRLSQGPFAGLVAAPPEIRHVANPVVVHIHSERRRWRIHRESPGFPRDFGKRVSESAQFLRDRHQQVPGSAKVIEVFLKEPVLPVVSCRPRTERLEEAVGQKTY